MPTHEELLRMVEAFDWRVVDAEEVPNLFRMILEPNADEDESTAEALELLGAWIVNQWDLAPHTAAVIDFLFELVEEPATPRRCEIAGLIASVAMATRDALERGKSDEAVKATEQALQDGVDAMLRWLESDDSELRAAAVHAFAFLPSEAARTRPALARALEREESPNLRTAIAYALVVVGERDALLLEAVTLPRARAILAAALADDGRVPLLQTIVMVIADDPGDIFLDRAIAEIEATGYVWR